MNKKPDALQEFLKTAKQKHGAKISRIAWTSQATDAFQIISQVSIKTKRDT